MGLRELALFAGAGGGILGGKLLGWRTVCAVELDAYARSVLLARQRDGVFDRFPIWDDIKTFDGRPWRGSVDVISGGWPCTPHSTASRGRANARDCWPDMLRIVEAVRPRFVFGENVKRAPVEKAARDLLAAGYSCARIAQAGASAVGAPHDRQRWWLFADADRKGERLRAINGEVAGLSCAAEELWPERDRQSFRVPDGVASRVERCRAIGNGQVPAVAALAWRVLGGP
mgnify:CR=1 FL=1